MNYTYIVQCADGTLYTGWTNYEGYATKEEAMSREYAIKQLTRAKKLALMEF